MTEKIIEIIPISKELELRLYEAPKRDDDPYTLKGYFYRRDKSNEWEFLLTRFFVNRERAISFIHETFKPEES